MKLFEIALPMFTNAGLDYDEAQEAWRRTALSVAGGFTDFGEHCGYWMDGDRLYQDQVRIYRVACDPAKWKVLIDAAFNLFSDQEAIFYAEIGEAVNHTRKGWLKYSATAANPETRRYHDCGDFQPED